MRPSARADVSYQPATRGSTPFRELRPFMSWGVPIAIAAGLLFGNLLSAYCLLVAFACAGLLWTRSEIPVLVFCVLYQWLFIVTGYFYLQLTGTYPGMRILGELDTALWYSLTGLIVLTSGIRLCLGRSALRPRLSNDSYDVTKLFWCVVILFSVNWLFEISAVQLRLVAFNVAQILNHLLFFRYLFLYLLLLTVVERRTGYGLATIAFAYVFLPELTSSMTKFKELFFLVFIVLLSQWRLGARDKAERAHNRNITIVLVSIVIFLLTIGLIWSGGLKHSWREALLSGEVAGSPIEKMAAYGEHAVQSVRTFEVERGAETLGSRMSSGLAYFSHVVRVVPESVSHEDGALIWRALRHVLMPRVLFPEKENLGGDSWLVRKYAGLNVAGNESGTSIGLGYMGEFYIDFGFPGMLLPCFMYGLFIGWLYRCLQRASPSRAFFAAVSAGLFLQHFLSFEGNFTKLFGGLLQNFLVVVVILLVLGRWMHGFLKEGSPDAEPKEPHSRAASTP